MYRFFKPSFEVSHFKIYNKSIFICLELLATNYGRDECSNIILYYIITLYIYIILFLYIIIIKTYI